MKVQARIALDGGGVYAVEVDPDELKSQLSDEGASFLEFADPGGFITLIPRDKVLMVQYGAGINFPLSSSRSSFPQASSPGRTRRSGKRKEL